MEEFEISHGAMEAPRARGLGARRGAIAGGLTAVVPTLLIRTLTVNWDDEDGGRRGVLSELLPGRWLILGRNAVIGSAAGAGLGYLLGGRSRERWVALEYPSVVATVTPISLAFSIPID